MKMGKNISGKMGYDRASTMFSPDGRLLQVEYARKTVSKGTTAVGIVCKDGVVLIADKRMTEDLVVPESVEKIYEVDDHVGVALSGLISDGRALVEEMREDCQQNKVTYDERMSATTVVKNISSYKQKYTQYAGVRPFGVALLIAGIDEKNGEKEPVLFMTEPSGIYFEYEAFAMGEGADTGKKMLEDKYKKSMKMDKGISLGLDILKDHLGDDFNTDRIDVARIPVETEKYEKLQKDEVKEYLD